MNNRHPSHPSSEEEIVVISSGAPAQLSGFPLEFAKEHGLVMPRSAWLTWRFQPFDTVPIMETPIQTGNYSETIVTIEPSKVTTTPKTIVKTEYSNVTTTPKSTAAVVISDISKKYLQSLFEGDYRASNSTPVQSKANDADCCASNTVPVQSNANYFDYLPISDLQTTDDFLIHLGQLPLPETSFNIELSYPYLNTIFASQTSKKSCDNETEMQAETLPSRPSS
ncbi:MAG: hypothetical protein A3F11_07905 [Gammaproteobacteria bacterium RIFCSPHIGHO2_12_FULL_37_14]|nr:MAG: hypothetical protein A3F11_07905 [Gammaproteobacteria bacterium RIFCSPHIGHO2_12_FULL_37_14]